MKQLLQYLKDGRTAVIDVPTPTVRPGTVLIRTSASLVSAGTERTLAEFAGKNLLAKAQSRPDLVRQVLDKARREGIVTALEAAFNRLDKPMPLGYSSAGTVVEVGPGMEGWSVGDRVACAGGGYAVHAEYGLVPKNLVVRIPESISFESAAFTTIGAIAMHGFRLARPQLGDRVAVIGLGLLGLLAGGIARAAGCEVLGIDISPARIALGKKMGLSACRRSDAEAQGSAFTRGRGFDVVLICADTRSNDTVELAGLLARDRAEVVAVGAVGLSIPRKIYYEKELHFQVSRSYGPGRYDNGYEERGNDYPIGYVRWTEGRNLEAFVDLLESKKIDVSPLISHRIPIDEAPRAYDLITGKLGEPFLGVLLTYPASGQDQPLQRRIDLSTAGQSRPPTSSISVGVLGAGNYGNAVFLPVIQKVGRADRVGIAAGTGLNAQHAGSRFGFRYAATSDQEILNDPNINTLVILTRHNLHASQVLDGYKAGKHVFCEKPLAITNSELDEISECLAQEQKNLLMVGFNRRFAPMSKALKAMMDQRSEPLYAHYRVNAGFIPSNHWVHDPVQGGGRIIGEGCHFIDYLTFLVGEPPVRVSTQALPDLGRYHEDNVVMTFSFRDGSLGIVSYLANGDKSVSKERVEVFAGGKVALLDDFRTLELVQDGRRTVYRSRLRQDKGHRGGWEAFLEAIEHGSAAPIPYAHLIGVSRAAIAAVQSLETNVPVEICLA
jgi:predicted dehydrogenase/threonine dehydrogenase-like Zn-dependent dehydrogenase